MSRGDSKSRTACDDELDAEGIDMSDAVVLKPDNELNSQGIGTSAPMPFSSADELNFKGFGSECIIGAAFGIGSSVLTNIEEDDELPPTRTGAARAAGRGGELPPSRLGAAGADWGGAFAREIAAPGAARAAGGGAFAREIAVSLGGAAGGGGFACTLGGGAASGGPMGGVVRGSGGVISCPDPLASAPPTSRGIAKGGGALRGIANVGGGAFGGIPSGCALGERWGLGGDVFAGGGTIFAGVDISKDTEAAPSLPASWC